MHSHFTRTLEGGPYTLKYKGSMWGYKRFFKRAVLETSDYLKDDCLTINCTIGVVSSVTDCPRLHTVQIPDSDIGLHFAMLLENQEHSDVVFDVAGEKFHAHKLILAARSPNFRAEFLDGLDGENNSLVITDLEPKVFKAMLHFIYTDTLVEDDVLITSGSPVSSVSDTLLAKLLASADKYELDRLRLMCESYLCKYLSVDSFASILALADRHHAAELKVACLKYAAGNLAAVMRSDGFKYLKEYSPSVQSELLKMVAGDDEECSSDSKNLSVRAQVVDGGDSRGRRRVRPRLL